MQILIVAASRHGSTREIADVIANDLREAGFGCDVCTPQGIDAITGYDAVILGSAIYMGAWLGDAERFGARHHTALSSRPLWLFSSGPLGDFSAPDDPPSGVLNLMQTTGAREHRTFSGRLIRHDLGRGERLMARLVHAPDGDFRNWKDVHNWAQEIATELLTHPAHTTAE